MFSTVNVPFRMPFTFSASAYSFMVYVYVYYGGYAVHAAGEHSDTSQTAKYLSEECSLEATGHYEVPVRFPAIALEWNLRLIKMSMNNSTLSTY